MSRGRTSAVPYRASVRRAPDSTGTLTRISSGRSGAGPDGTASTRVVRTKPAAPSAAPARGTSWYRPATDGSSGSVAVIRRPPATTKSLQTTFYIASASSTHGPPAALHPADVAIVSSKPSSSAFSVANRIALRHSGDWNTSRFETSCGAFMPPSNTWAPPMPTRCIHPKSSAMPFSSMLPFIQCHHTRGRASSGGEANPSQRLFIPVLVLVTVPPGRRGEELGELRRVRRRLLRSVSGAEQPENHGYPQPRYRGSAISSAGELGLPAE